MWGGSPEPRRAPLPGSCGINKSEEANEGVGRGPYFVTSPEHMHAILAATIEGVLSTSNGRWLEIVVVDDGSITPVSFSHPDVVILRNAERLLGAPGHA